MRRPPTSAAPAVQDLSALPTAGFSSHGLWYWAGLAFMLMEGSAFSLACAAYVYLMNSAGQWPLEGRAPALTWGTVQTVLLLGSLIPTWFLSKASLRRDLKATQSWGVLVAGLNALALVIRGVEFFHLNTRWDQDAYGSITWTLIILHTLHLITDFVDTFFLTVFLFTHPVPTERFSDVEDDAIYWAYVVFTWLPLYLLIYLAPRWAP